MSEWPMLLLNDMVQAEVQLRSWSVAPMQPGSVLISEAPSKAMHAPKIKGQVSVLESCYP